MSQNDGLVSAIDEIKRTGSPVRLVPVAREVAPNPDSNLVAGAPNRRGVIIIHGSLVGD
jgi:hypothetical protein